MSSLDKCSRPPPTTMLACGSGRGSRVSCFFAKKLFTYPKIKSRAVFFGVSGYVACSVDIRTVGTTCGLKHVKKSVLAKLALKVKNGMDWKLKCKKGNLGKIKWIS